MRKLIVILLCVCTLLSGCGNSQFNKMGAKKQRAYMQELIKNKDVNGMFTLFAPATISEVGEDELRREIEELISFCDGESASIKDNGYSEGSSSNRGVRRVERKLSWDVTINGEVYTIGASVIPTCTEDEEECGIYEIHVQKWSDIDENGLAYDYFDVRGINITY